MSKEYPVPEASFASFIEQTLSLYHYTWYHTKDSRGSREGFPDYVAVNMEGTMVFFIEIKGEDAQGRPGKLTPSQEAWGAALASHRPHVGCPALHARWYSWWPEDQDAAFKVLSA